ncbi:MAG: hypothetical protein K0Q89_43 [Thermomicrobiales bacterium]|jgi:hypothetical protein|nr:hypothetical protein [Thermomicrobiales bacterium]
MTTTRLNKDRYIVHGEWRYAAHRHGLVDRGDDVQPALIEIKVADLLEKRSEHVWKDGAYKVILQNVPGKLRSKTFYGETAWSDAARYASDAATACGWRWHPDL